MHSEPIGTMSRSPPETCESAKTPLRCKNFKIFQTHRRSSRVYGRVFLRSKQARKCAVLITFVADAAKEVSIFQCRDQQSLIRKNILRVIMVARTSCPCGGEKKFGVAASSPLNRAPNQPYPHNGFKILLFFSPRHADGICYGSRPLDAGSVCRY